MFSFTARTQPTRDDDLDQKELMPSPATNNHSNDDWTMMMDVSLDHARNCRTDLDESYHSLYDLEELLLEAGLTRQQQKVREEDRKRHHLVDARMTNASNATLRNDKKQRRQLSSSFSDDLSGRSFTTALINLNDDADGDVEEALDCDVVSTDNSSDDFVMTGFPPGTDTPLTDDGDHLEECTDRPDFIDNDPGYPKSKHRCLSPAPGDEQGSSHEEKKLMYDTEAENVLTIPVTGVTLLRPKDVKFKETTEPNINNNTNFHQGSNNGNTNRIHHAESHILTPVSTLQFEDDANSLSSHSVASVQSLISVVAELINIPVRVFSAVVADLEQEINASHPPERAQFLCASVFLPPLNENDNKNDPIDFGMKMEQQSSITSPDHCYPVIQSIDPQGLWGQSPFRVGDRLWSINHQPVKDMHVEELEALWNGLTQSDDRSVTLVARNPSGNAGWVESMITKPEPTARTGVGMRSSRPGRIKISRVAGLFANSILNPGDQILSINGTKLDGYTSSETAQLILESPRQVSVVAKSNSQAAFVISSKNDRGVSTSRSTLSRSDRLTSDSSDLVDSYRRLADIGVSRTQHKCCHGPITPLKSLEWTAWLYIVFVFVLGMAACLSHQVQLPLVCGLILGVVVMANMVHTSIRTLQRQVELKLPSQWCSMFQVSCNVILAAAWTFLFILWGNFNYVSTELLLSLVALLFFPMTFFVNISILLPAWVIRLEQLYQDEMNIENDIRVDNIGQQSNDDEPEAVASLAGMP